MQNIICPICKTDSICIYWIPTIEFQESVKQVKFFRSNFKQDDQLIKCKHCHHVFLYPFRTSSDDIEFNENDDNGLMKYTSFRMFAKNSKEGYYFPKKYLKNKRRALENYILPYKFHKNNIHQSSYLDIGCGVGFLVYAGLQKGLNSTGIEIDTLAANYGKKQFGINILCENIEKYEFPINNTFDIITMTHTLEHIINLHNIIKKIWLIMNNDGLLTIEVPNIFSDSANEDFINWEFNSGEVHLHFFSMHSLQKLLTDNGFIIEKAETNNNNKNDWLGGDCLVIYARKKEYNNCLLK